MYTVHATKKLADRIGVAFEPPCPEPSTRLGNWYATLLPWKRQVALFVNETTFLPVYAPLAPARSMLQRFPDHLAAVLTELNLRADVIAAEHTQMHDVTIAKTASRQVLGVINEFTVHADAAINHGWNPDDLIGLSARVSDVLISPLGARRGDYGTPRDALHRLLANPD